jgi:three-Cys-motif partner protein
MDQTSMQVRLGAIRRLSDRKKVDLIVNFPLNMSLKRVFPLESQKAAWSEMDFFFDGPEWRELYNRYAGTDRFDNEVIDLYKSKLRSYGYIKVEDSRSIPIHRTWSHKLYYLIFASKHPLGNLFWNITAKNRPNGQREFSF